MKKPLIEYIREESQCHYADIQDYLKDLEQCDDKLRAGYLLKLFSFILQKEQLEMKELDKKISRAKTKIEGLKKKHGNTPGLTHTYHAGWDLGYYQGRLSILEDLSDELEEQSLNG